MARHRLGPVVWWARRLLSGQPHQVIGDNSPYMLRWWVLPPNLRLSHERGEPVASKHFKVYVHKFLRSDDDRALHDHPWWFVSLVLRGSYLEYTPGCGLPHLRKPGSIAYREATTRHRVSLVNGWGRDHRTYGPQPCWTLIVTGPKVRDWGFWCPATGMAGYMGRAFGVGVERFVPWWEWGEGGCGEQ